jgi:putative transcriptional regulator
MNKEENTNFEGKVLVADPFLQDPYFSRSVVLVTEMNENGSIGFILNKPLTLSVEDAIEGFPEFDKFLSLGGPVDQETMLFVHKRGDILDGSLKLSNDLYWGGDFEQLKVLISQDLIKSDEVYFYLGYAGWSPEQLQAEIAQGNWSISEFSSLYLEDDEPDNVWKRAMLRSDSTSAFLANFPENPSLN